MTDRQTGQTLEQDSTNLSILSFSQQVNGHPEPYSAGLPPSFGSSENLITAESVNEKQQSNGNNENQQQVSVNKGLKGDECDIFLGTSSY